MAEMGDGLEAIVEECEAGGIAPPDEILAHFEQREPWMDFYLLAYQDLASDRGSSGKVSWLTLDRYCERLGFDDDFSLWFMRCIRVIDDAFTEVWRQQQKDEEERLKQKIKS